MNNFDIEALKNLFKNNIRVDTVSSPDVMNVIMRSAGNTTVPQENKVTELFQYIKGASEHNRPDLLAKYIKSKIKNHGFDINSPDEDGKTALEYAVMLPKAKPFVTVLLKLGADPNARDRMGYTAMHLIVSRHGCQDPHVVRYMLENGGNPNIEYCCGETPVHLAASQGREDVMKVLLEFGGNPRTRCEVMHGQTPLCRSKTDKTGKLLHKSIRKNDNKVDKAAASCAWCNLSPEDSSQLKRCSNCRVTMYCSRNCQQKDWKQGKHKQNCQGFVTIDMKRSHCIQGTVKTGEKIKPMTLFPPEFLSDPTPDYLKGKQIVLKLEYDEQSIYYEGEMHDGRKYIYVTNDDETVMSVLLEDDAGFSALQRAISEEQIEKELGSKKTAYFWAEISKDQDKILKIYPGKSVFGQDW